MEFGIGRRRSRRRVGIEMTRRIMKLLLMIMTIMMIMMIRMLTNVVAVLMMMPDGRKCSVEIRDEM